MKKILFLLLSLTFINGLIASNGARPLKIYGPSIKTPYRTNVGSFGNTNGDGLTYEEVGKIFDYSNESGETTFQVMTGSYYHNDAAAAQECDDVAKSNIVDFNVVCSPNGFSKTENRPISGTSTVGCKGCIICKCKKT